MTTAKAKRKIQYLDAVRPDLGAGAHALTLTQTVRRKKKNGDWEHLESFERTQTLFVSGPEFWLDRGHVASTSPPAGHSGDFSGHFPHIVLSDPTLPWQRRISEAPQEQDLPWVALLVLRDSELAGKTTAMRETTATVGSEIVTFAAGQSTELTINRDVFRRVAPTAAELRLLTHIRRVPHAAKAVDRGSLPGQDYAVSICARAPAVPGEYTAYLVSLVGLAKELPAVPDVPAAAGALTVVSLFEWSFTVEPADGSFIGILGRVDMGPLAVPVTDPAAEKDPVLRLATRALVQGYAALNHVLRNGEETVSWYRGPFLPLKSSPRPIRIANFNADQLLRYVPATGMLDASYAAAWQLGRQLALRETEFIAALGRWRNALIIEEAAPTGRPKKTDADGGQTLGKAAADAPLLRAALSRLQRPPTVTAAGTPPDADQALITHWLAELALLQRVPLHYLVPDPNALPPESIRFFRIDRNWIMALLSGALSLGGESDEWTRKAHGTLKIRAEAYSRTLRSYLVEGTADAGTATPADPHRTFSGFLLRSRAVSGWKGLEIEIDPVAGGKAAIIRSELLEDDILLCLTQGDIAVIRILEPSEALTFPVPRADDRLWKRQADATHRIDGTPVGSRTGATLARERTSAGRAIEYKLSDLKPQS